MIFPSRRNNDAGCETYLLSGNDILRYTANVSLSYCTPLAPGRPGGTDCVIGDSANCLHFAIVHPGNSRAIGVHAWPECAAART